MTTVDTRPNGAAIAAQTGVRHHPVDDAAGPAAATPANYVHAVSRRRWWRRWLGTQQPGRADHPDDGMRTLHLVRRSRRAAVWLTVGIATVSFVLSFTSLRDLAAMSAWPGWPSWLWPLIIDGTIILATLGIVSLAPYRDQFWNRVFLWVVLSAAALVSVGGNGLHAWLSTAHLVFWMQWGSAALACAPPAALLATTHILAILWRFNPTPPPDATSQLRDRALQLAVERIDKWDAAAAKMHEEGYCQNVPTTKLAHALRYLYETRPAMSLRAIGAQPEVDLHHDTVSKIRDAAPVVLGVAAAGGR
ncbi:DUF2637 domain-containing protein [Mycobacterium sp.]|uniref:DUF2637 domain-containing protein n=1 Tax=Mycobacterium sp. TaxID=1785 RepID=UPI003C732C33